VEGFVGALGFAILWLMHRYAAEERWLFGMMCVPIGIAVLGCFLLPIMKIRAERAKGDLLAYETGREVLQLPRERLSLRKAQIMEFRILQEWGRMADLDGDSWAPKEEASGAAELQVIYRNPKPKTVTLLRASGCRPFNDVVVALKALGVAKVMMVEQQPDLTEWKANEV